MGAACRLFVCDARRAAAPRAPALRRERERNAGRLSAASLAQVSAGRNPYKNIHSGGGPSGLASRNRTPSRPRSAHLLRQSEPSAGPLSSGSRPTSARSTGPRPLSARSARSLSGRSPPRGGEGSVADPYEVERMAYRCVGLDTGVKLSPADCGACSVSEAAASVMPAAQPGEQPPAGPARAEARRGRDGGGGGGPGGPGGGAHRGVRQPAAAPCRPRVERCQPRQDGALGLDTDTCMPHVRVKPCGAPPPDMSLRGGPFCEDASTSSAEDPRWGFR
eukprot:6827236-Pyramimonas_sp.AAC.1